MANPLRAYREKNALSQEALAARLGVSRQMVGLLEKGEREWFSAGAADMPVAGEAVDSLIATRLSLIREKNFAEADRIRAELAEKGIQLMDYKDPETGERRTRWEVKR